MTVKILSGGAAAVAVPSGDKEKNIASAEGKTPVAERSPVITDDALLSRGYGQTYGAENDTRGTHRTRRYRRGRLSFASVFLIQLIFCGLLFAAALSALCFAPDGEAVRAIIEKFM